MRAGLWRVLKVGLLGSAAAALFVSSFIWGTVMADDSSGVAIEDLIRQAESLHIEAQQKEHAWVVTHRLILEARAALSAGRIDDAKSIATRAVQTAQASVDQADREQAAWSARVPQ